MTAVVSREHAKSTCLTGAAGVLVLAIAFVMMLVAAPHIQHRAPAPARPLAARLTSDPCHQLTSGSDSATVRTCRVGPLAVSV